MGIEERHWNELKPLAGRVFGSSLHFAISTINPDGTPHVTPIGSLILTDPGKAYFFEVFTQKLPRNLDIGSPVAVLGVISSSQLWLRSLLTGRFSCPPAFRLLGEAGQRRASTPEERARWRRKVRLVKWTRGNELLWGNLDVVRELHFHTVQPVEMGRMTADRGRL
jgi:hypothetical protein